MKTDRREFLKGAAGMGAAAAVVLAAALAARALPVDQAIVLLPLLGALAPSASNINQLAILYRKDAAYASAINVFTNLCCILSMPLWIMVYEALAGGIPG